MQTQQQQPTGGLVARSAMPQQLSHPSNSLGFAASAFGSAAISAAANPAASAPQNRRRPKRAWRLLHPIQR
jgi:hypothetical protein